MTPWAIGSLVVACSGPDEVTPDTGQEHCDPTQPSLELPDAYADGDLLHAQMAPSEIDEQSDLYPASVHQLLVRTDIELRDELFVILPGTANWAQAFTRPGRLAANAGYPVLILAYDSELSQYDYCTDFTEVDAHIACRTAVLQEKAYGNDTSDQLDVDEPNSIVGGARRAVARVDELYPEYGADAWLSGDTLAWERIVLSGFSQGATLTSLISHDHGVARAIFLAGGCDSGQFEGEIHLTDWCHDAFATPPERTFVFRHARDDAEEDDLTYEAMGLFELGDPADADTQSPACCTNAHVVESNLPSQGGGSKYHLSIAHDEFIPVDDDGVPVLAEDYLYLFTGGE